MQALVHVKSITNSNNWLLVHLLLTKSRLTKILLWLSILLHLWLLVHLLLTVARLTLYPILLLIKTYLSHSHSWLRNDDFRCTVTLSIHSDGHVGSLTCTHDNNSVSLDFLSSEVDSTCWHTLQENLNILFVVVMVRSQ